MTNKTKDFVEQVWDNSIVPAITRYIAIPCKSPSFDKHWEKNGYIDQAIELVVDWCHAQKVKGLELEVHRLPGRTPLLVLEVAANNHNDSVLLYGHLDKQPEMVGWDEDLGPWKPVLKNNRLYGRGGADDGYAVFSGLTAIKALQEQNLPHPRCIIIIECCEESGSYDLPFYISYLEEKIGKPSLVIGLDSGCGNYDQFWTTTSLRGLVTGAFTVEILTEGVHSGSASGVVPSSFRLLRQLISRIEDPETGEILLDELNVDIPKPRLIEAEKTAEVLGDKVWMDYPWVDGAKPRAMTKADMVINRTWKAALSITGVEGMPSLEDAGNVLRPKTTVMLSMRIPPTCNPVQAAEAIKRVLEKDPPYNAKVSFTINKKSAGWSAPLTQDWLTRLLDESSKRYFGRSSMYWGEGGSIPFMYMLGEKFPEAQFVITGVLGPNSNAHGPNEFLDIPMGKKITCCIADVLQNIPLIL